VKEIDSKFKVIKEIKEISQDISKEFKVCIEHLKAQNLL